MQKRFNDLKALNDFCLLLTGSGLKLGTKLLGELLAVDIAEKLLYSLRAHARVKIVLVFLAHITVLFFREHLIFLQRGHSGVGNDI